MTVIAYRSGIMASDSMCVFDTGGPGTKSTCNKILRRKGFLLAVAGNLTPPDELFLEWFFQNADTYEKPPLAHYKFDALVATPEGKLQSWDQKGRFDVIGKPFFAIGAGCEFAMGAMAAGATARKAVEIAIGLSPLCSGPVQVKKHYGR